MEILIPVSVGELLDKITILEIKCNKIDNTSKKEIVMYELHRLSKIRKLANLPEAALNNLIIELKLVNSELWKIEDAKRLAEEQENFDANFIQNARMVYIKNDYRAKLKRMINEISGSKIIEVKSHDNA